MKVMEAETEAEQNRIIDARLAQHAEEEGEPEHSYFKLAATNVNGRLRLKDREHLLPVSYTHLTLPTIYSV